MRNTDRDTRQPYGAYLRDKMPRAADDELTQIGPGTPCGEYFRRFWLPVALTSELADVPLRVRILGEDLVLFRDLSGELGLLELHCPHRGASLEYGKIRDHGIACCYHGWHFAVDGTILEMPTHGADATLEERLFQGAYPVHEYAGMVFAYMGPPERKPPFPVYDVFEKPGVTHHVYKFSWPCNWLQIRENGMDPLHGKYLHADAGQKFPPTFGVVPTLDFHESPLGMLYITTRRIGDMIYLRQNELFLPVADWINGLEDAQGETIFDRRGGGTDFVVPIDDTHSHFIMMLDVTEDQNDTGMNGLFDRDKSREVALGLNDSIPTSGQNGDRPYQERQRSAGDWDAITTQGAVHSHSGEHLGVSDAGVVQYRNMVRREIQKVQAGEDPKGLCHGASSPIRTHGHNTVMRVPHGATPEQDKAICEAFYREFLKEVLEGDLQQDLPANDKWKIAREILSRVNSSVA